MAVPLLILYEISIVIARIFGKKPTSEEEDDDEDADTPESDEKEQPEE